MSLYAYVRSMPVVGVDPWGYFGLLAQPVPSVRPPPQPPLRLVHPPGGDPYYYPIPGTPSAPNRTRPGTPSPWLPELSPDYRPPGRGGPDWIELPSMHPPGECHPPVLIPRDGKRQRPLDGLREDEHPKRTPKARPLPPDPEMGPPEEPCRKALTHKFDACRWYSCSRNMPNRWADHVAYCKELINRHNRGNECLNARREVTRACFGGIDNSGRQHFGQERKVINAMDNCTDLWAKHCSGKNSPSSIELDPAMPSLPPVPMLPIHTIPHRLHPTVSPSH
ncbi:hypothetical protein [Leptolyngbya sp. 7M]|uniref:hypothetical protein n=1 Tax=Leptolyngbya sp. 7M TaxID=2812896 RepID=UPI001B8C96AD|nr:hypothetical protein [Leptolyngbya sp. 7M]QYO63107.1 hypothetical protein JVX88_24520 [Leptolyngbya sp. 7M]